MKTLSFEWFSDAKGLVGIVLVEGEAGDEGLQRGERGAYVGIGLGLDEEEDVQGILDWGCLLRQDRALKILQHFLPAAPCPHVHDDKTVWRCDHGYLAP